MHIWVHALDKNHQPIPSHRKIDSEFYARLDGARVAPVYISINKPASRNLEWSCFCCDRLASATPLHIWLEPIEELFERRSPPVMRHQGMKQYTYPTPFEAIGSMFRRLQQITFTLDKPFGVSNDLVCLDLEHHEGLVSHSSHLKPHFARSVSSFDTRPAPHFICCYWACTSMRYLPRRNLTDHWEHHPIVTDEEQMASVFLWIGEHLVCHLPTCELVTTEPAFLEAHAAYEEVLEDLRLVQQMRNSRALESSTRRPCLATNTQRLEVPIVDSEPRVSPRLKGILKHRD